MVYKHFTLAIIIELNFVMNRSVVMRDYKLNQIISRDIMKSKSNHHTSSHHKSSKREPANSRNSNKRQAVVSKAAVSVQKVEEEPNSGFSNYLKSSSGEMLTF